MKALEFLGSSLDDLREMPAGIRHAIGVELMRVQLGGEPTAFKPIWLLGRVRTRFVYAMVRAHFV